MSQWALYLSGGPPLVAGATTFVLKGGHHGCWAVCHMILRVSIERSILPPEWGEVRRSRIGGGHRRWLIQQGRSRDMKRIAEEAADWRSVMR